MLQCEPDGSLLQRGPPAPPVFPLLLVRHSSGCRAAPHARAGGDKLRGVADAAVSVKQLAPRRIGVSGLVDQVQKGPDALLLEAAVALRLVEAAHVQVCDPPV